MNYSDLKTIVSTGAHVKIKSSQLRFSELHSLVHIASTLEGGIITIIVECATLTNSELISLAKLGGNNVQLDLTPA